MVRKETTAPNQDKHRGPPEGKCEIQGRKRHEQEYHAAIKRRYKTGERNPASGKGICRKDDGNIEEMREDGSHSL